MAAAAAAAAAPLLAACRPAPAPTSFAGGVVPVVAAENTYGDVAAQVGGRFVRVVSIETNPNADPHAYEVSPSVAGEVAGAGLVVQNGLGYDSYMDRLVAASPNPHRKVVVAQAVLGLPSDTPNPHLWYDPRTMPAVAAAVAADLADLAPVHAAAFRANAAAFDASLRPWRRAIASFKASHGGTPAATTEPVADDLLAAMGIDNLTPFSLQAAIMNGTDPSPQDIDLVTGYLSRRAVKVFVYNRQVVDTLTRSLRSTARRAGVPVVGVDETMPAGDTYQTWMLAATSTIGRAVVSGESTAPR